MSKHRRTSGSSKTRSTSSNSPSSWTDPNRPDRPDALEFIVGRNEAVYNIYRGWDGTYGVQTDISRFPAISEQEVARLRSAGRVWEANHRDSEGVRE